MKLIILITIASAIAMFGSTLEAEGHSGNWQVVKWNGTYLRTCPSTACGKIVLIPSGNFISLDRHRGNWAMGWYGDVRGWISLNTITSPVPSTPSAPSGGGTCFPNTWGQVVCAEGWMADEIAAAANAYGVSYWELMSVAACESNFDPATTGWAGEVGIFQWVPDTWDWIGSGDRYSTYDQIWATARAFANGYQSNWTCYYRI